MVANTYLEGTYSEIYPAIPQNEEGMQRLFRQFSFPGGIPSHASPETPGSINEGGELGYAVLHAYGAVFDNPGSARLLRGRRRRSRDRPLRHQLALEQIPQSRARRRGAADPASERIQDRRTHRAGAIAARGTGVALHRLWVQMLLRRRPRARRHASEDGRHHGHRHRGNPGHSSRTPAPTVSTNAQHGR